MKRLSALFRLALVPVLALAVIIATTPRAFAASGNFVAYSHGLHKILDGTVDLDTDALRLVLVTSSYTFAQNTDDAWSDISANEVSGTGYTANGKLLTCTVTRSSAVITFDCDDQAWTGSTLTVKNAIIVHDANGDGTLAATDIPLFRADLETGGGSISTTNGALTITMNPTTGVYFITAAGS